MPPGAVHPNKIIVVRAVQTGETEYFEPPEKPR